MSLFDPINGFTPVWIDYETFSECDLKKHGSYVYAEHPSTRVLCAAIFVNGHRIFWTLERYNIQPLPGFQYVVGIDFLRSMFESPIMGIAHNVDFERPITTKTLKLPEPQGGWRDTADLTLMRGLPAGADAAGQYLLGMGKDYEGYALMMKHCKPDKKGVALPITDSVIQRYQSYNWRDVEIQFGITERFGIEINPEWERRVNNLHRSINHRGVQLDVKFATTLKSFDDVFKNEACRAVEDATLGVVKGSDLRRNDFIREYLKTQGLEIDNMRADTIETILEADEAGEIPSDDGQLPLEIYSVLTNRMVVTRAALAKVETALRSSCADGRIYALLRYWGARTGRWSGKMLQIQNLRRPNEDFDLEAAILAVENNDIEAFTTLCKGHRPYELLSSLIRGILIPRPGCVFVAADFAQIEARVLLWMAEDWINLQEHVEYDLGRGPDIYCRFASFLYKKEITKKQFPMERQIGKIGELACGYGGSVGAVNRFAYSGGIDLGAVGIDPKTLVDAWRTKHPLVTDMWRRSEDCFRRAIRSQGKEFLAARCSFIGYPDRVEIRLPSGRILTYMNARLVQSRRIGWEDSEVIAYDSAVKGQVKHEELYGGRIIENIDQAISRDLLADAMLRIDEQGDDIVFHVHDEACVEVPEDYAEEAAKAIGKIMCTAPEWGKGIPVSAKPDILTRYGK